MRTAVNLGSAPDFLLLLEEVARDFKAQLKPEVLRTFNGRLERGLALVRENAVTPLKERQYEVRSANAKQSPYSYQVNLAERSCTCPDSQKGNICKHRVAAYYYEQAMKIRNRALNRLKEMQLLKELGYEEDYPGRNENYLRSGQFLVDNGLEEGCWVRIENITWEKISQHAGTFPVNHTCAWVSGLPGEESELKGILLDHQAREDLITIFGQQPALVGQKVYVYPYRIYHEGKPLHLLRFRGAK